MSRTTTKANSTISAPRSSSRRLRPFGFPQVRGPNVDAPPSVSRAPAPTVKENVELARRFDTSGSILGRRLPTVHRSYGPFHAPTRDAASENELKDLCTSPPARRTLNGASCRRTREESPHVAD